MTSSESHQEGSRGFSIIVPVLNEREVIQSVLNYLGQLRRELTQYSLHDWEFVIVDAGSTDGTAEFLSGVNMLSNTVLVLGGLKMPSIGKTVSLGLSRASGSTIIILPCDCRLDSEALLELAELTSKTDVICGGFPKTYEPSSHLLIVYQILQNVFRFGMLRHLVWTNGIFFSKVLVNPEEFPASGFLEDILLSDRIRRHPNWSPLKSRIMVSSRRYLQRSQLKRMSLNILILITYRLKFMSEMQLRAIYYK